MKRYFVSVGSQATEGLYRLIANLMAENLFSKYEDVYVAIDSAQQESAPWGLVRKLAGSVKRIHAVELDIDEDDKAVLAFQSSWTQTGIDKGGVGGDRTLSEKARSWRTQIQEVVLDKLDRDDWVILLGSSFGGTSSGLYWGVADYLSNGMQEKAAEYDWESGSVTFIGFAMLPDKFLDKSNKKYPLASNVCDFMREMQTAHWRRRLAGQVAGFRFAAPIYTRERNGSIPLYYYEKEGQHHPVSNVSGDDLKSYLPMTTLYWVPTPQNQIALSSVLLAEQVFAVTYIGVSVAEFGVKAIDRWGRGNGPKHTMVEDPCFAGLRLLVFKSGRAKVIRKWFHTEWARAEKRFRTQPESSDVTINIRTALENIFYGSRDERSFGQDSTSGLPNTENLRRYGERFFQSDTPSFDELAKLIDGTIQEAQGFRNVDATTFFRHLSKLSDGWMSDLGVTDLTAAYQMFYEQTQVLAESTDNAKNELLRIAERTWALLGKRSGSRAVKVLAKENTVAEEIRETFMRKFAAGIDKVRLAARCRKTLNYRTLRPVAEFRRAIDDILARLTEVRNLEDEAGALDNDYVIQGNDDLTLALPSECLKELRPFVTFLLEAGLVADLGTRKSLLAAFEQETLAKLATTIDAFINDGGTDPIENVGVATTDGLGDRKLFCSAFTTEGHSEGFVNQFAIVRGRLPNPFVITKAEVKKRLRLNSFKNMDNEIDRNFFTVNDKGEFVPEYLKDPDKQGKPRFLGHGARKTPTINGVWLGEICEDFTLRETLDAVFGHQTLFEWQDQTITLAAGKKTPRRLFTLQQMVFMGIIISAIEEKVSGQWSSRRHTDMISNYRVQLVFKPSIPERPEMKLGPIFCNEAGFKDIRDADAEHNLILDSLCEEWMRKLAKWVTAETGDLTSFYAAYFDPPRRDDWKTFTSIDQEILLRGRLQIKDYEIDAIKKLREVVVRNLTAELVLSNQNMTIAHNDGGTER